MWPGIIDARAQYRAVAQRLRNTDIGGWMGPRATMDRCRKSRLHRYLIPGPSSPYQITILTILSQSESWHYSHVEIQFLPIQRKYKLKVFSH